MCRRNIVIECAVDQRFRFVFWFGFDFGTGCVAGAQAKALHCTGAIILPCAAKFEQKGLR